MTYSSCLRYPESSRFIQLHEWQKEFCRGDHCAAFLLSFFSSWHDWKLLNDHYYRRYNDIAEAHGDGRPNNENAYLFFTMDDLSEALMGLFGKKSISDGINLLASLGVITVHKNPNPRYCFDKTKYFKFYPEVCNKWLQDNYSLNKNVEKDTQVIDNFHNAEMDNRSRKNALPLSKNERPSRKNARYIKNYNTNNNTNHTQSINAHDDFDHHCEKSSQNVITNDAVQSIITVLTEKGMQLKYFYPATINDIQQLLDVGASVEIFLEAYDLSQRTTQGQGFGVSYLVKVVKSLLNKMQTANSKDPPQFPKDRFSDAVYENDIRNALNWIKGEYKCKQAEK